MNKRFELLDRSLAYDGFFRIEKYRLRHGLFDGGYGPELTRELFDRGHSVGVLPYDAVRDEVVLVEQFRVGALEDPRGPWLMETVAGMVEEGQTAEQVARRESLEEADCRLGELIPICDYYVSPGGSSEKVAVFCAQANTKGLGGVHGLADEGEDIQVHVVSFDAAMNMIETGVINSAMPIIALQWLALNRERVQDLWGDD
ncbi:ADP-ribose diphosphatase [Alkalilimnicola ehrlichii]|uniref:ADP-ribose pyrophosphatase n=1 Tax=Alkalilimnicola ehrlichii TaxID=351052 RepID=A0A3E0X1J5_9GAMM|nr:NUDIX domain-containing protein [Alkalilimnicola ehrlichii]RFA28338.1 ADP-ribose diphosphatase [Alkalilimnicola ehrlichii]RFA38596.1 ADP-ribose diphosphatase [Alkalilimnicola ehrlichii]